MDKDVSPMADSLGTESRLIFTEGILAWITVPSRGHLSVGAKSLLTSTIKETNLGRMAA
jgi:aldehyde:ferredoxin oxidoreductase